jgi:hypothetical protein
MKKTFLYIAIVASLAVLAWWVIAKQNSNSTMQALEAQYDFAVSDTAAITKIIISDKRPSHVELTRTQKGWFVNGSYLARQDGIEVLLETLNRMTMRNFVPEQTKTTIIKRLAVYGKEVQVFSGDERIKHFFVGTETPDQLGTYMMLAGAKLPFAMHMQGFNGYLNSRFFTEEELWRDRTIFGIDKEAIANVELKYNIGSESSFKIDAAGAQPILKDGSGKVLQGFKPVNMNIFLGSFRTANYEAMVIPTDGTWAKKDSLQNSLPLLELTVTDKAGKTHSLMAYRKRPDTKDEMGEDGLPLQWDLNRLYAFLDDGRMVLIQYYGLRNILVNKEFFFQELQMDN